jgi:L-lactate utilization protein LutC
VSAREDILERIRTNRPKGRYALPSAIVRGMRDAYQHPVFTTARYAVFHTGPSATGDIEGVLIHGAQGVRSLTVLLEE